MRDDAQKYNIERVRMEEELNDKMKRETREMNDFKRRSFLSTMNKDN